MKKLLITTLFTIGLAINAEAAANDIGADAYIAYAVSTNTASSTTYTNATNTATTTWDIEVDNNYSEILGFSDCKALNKRVTQRVDKINEKLDKQQKAVYNLIDKINEIKDDEDMQNNASTTDALKEEAKSLEIKMQILATGTLKYVKSLKNIDIIKCAPNVKSIKAQIVYTKPLYKDILIADSDLKSYISNEVKQTLIILKGEVPTMTLGATSATNTKDKVEEKGFWYTVKGLFK